MRGSQPFLGPGDAFNTLRKLRKAVVRYDAQPDAERLVETLQHAHWVDATFARAVRDAIRDQGLDPGPDWQPAPLRVGETWLLLCDQETGEGMASRLRYVPDRVLCPSLTADARIHADRALRELETAIGAGGRRLSSRPSPERFEVSSACPCGATVRDDSLGTAVCAAVLSHQLHQAPRQDVAASACVLKDGTLGTVDCLDEKLQALARMWPGVRDVVVAQDQEAPSAKPESITLLPRRTLVDAMSEFGLDWTRLPPCPLDHHLRQVRDFEYQNKLPHSIDDWRHWSWVAFQASVALRSQHESDSIDARGWAALFALHAGDNARSTDLLRPMVERLEELPARPRMVAMIVRATNAIDGDPEKAIAFARQALDAALEEKESEPALYGQALGTLGRACMHRGDLTRAEPYLRAAVAFHESVEQLEIEGPRSRTYLATCLRKVGRPAEALAVLDRALESIDRFNQYQLSFTTRLYVELERGRCFLDMGELPRAVEAFEVCRLGQRDVRDYPKLGAMRGLALAHRSLGNVAQADEIVRECLKVARQEGDKLLGRVAAIAAGETLASGLPTQIARHELETVWDACFHRSATRSELDRVLATWIY